MSEYIVEMYDECEKYSSEYGCKPTNTHGFPLREEIVRCRDCVHYKPYRTHKHGMMNRCHDEHGHTHKRDESDFCSRGERRADDN